VQRNALESRSTPSPTPLLTATPEPTIDPTPSPLPSLSPEPEIVLSEYKVQVLNGTGGKGVAGAVKDILEAEGFENVEADNADELDHTKTTIQLKADTPETVWEAIKKVLDSDYDVVKSNEFLSEESDYDVIITVGVLSTIE
ncbi:MAG: LytR C-terminal domain-containing protein, partial [Candidatus Beckwithbacteria bacterium]